MSHQFPSVLPWVESNFEDVQAINDAFKMHHLDHASPSALSVTASSPPSTSSTSAAPAGASPLPVDTPKVLPSPDIEMATGPSRRKTRALQMDQSPWTMIEASQEPNADELHPDLDRTNIIHLSRILALMQCGWTITRGRGPRNHDFCLWCRGPLTDHTELLVHSCDAGGNTKCNNAWPASCFMTNFLNHELKHNGAGRKSISCPMCRGLIIRTKITLVSPSAQTSDFEPPEKNKAYPALIRIMFFSTENALQEAQTNTKRVFVMERSEVAKLAKLGRNKVLFKCLDAMMHFKRCNEHLFDSWLAIDCGDNEYRLTPLIHRAKDEPDPYSGTITACRQNCVTAEKLEEEASNNGGLVKVVATFRPDFAEEIKQMVTAGREELSNFLTQWMTQEPNVDVRESQLKAYSTSLKDIFNIVDPSHSPPRPKFLSDLQPGFHFPPDMQPGGNGQTPQDQDLDEEAVASTGMSTEDSDEDEDEDEDDDVEESQEAEEGDDGEEGHGNWDMM
ncbi:hypothetical protein PV08_00811 [Exophiala spinifera]|uniref:Uncharacterized protein n=1 Tax=Exophiala spinifera TaxID=91928 RepID=A0A0D1YY71_9EURO|nr:uncharacterized protein PV08_00811 [Exophiala spinifera]KIW20236.1 hypothetical protein PV08_00811 [Exophiala spinifera]